MNRRGLTFLHSLTRRGLRGVKLVISDAHEGLKAAAAKIRRANWQRCRALHAQRWRTQTRPSAAYSAAIATAFAQV